MQADRGSLPHIIMLLFALLLQSCASYSLDKAQYNLRTNFASGDFEASAELLDKMETREVYKEKDDVLLNLERGMVHRFTGNFSDSNLYLSRAEQGIEENFTRSITRGISSLLINDSQLVYGGEDYEDVYINVFKALNYIHMDNYEAALVEARRIAFKLEGIEVRNRGLAEMYARADTLNGSDWNPGDHVVENSAFGHYLSAILFAKTGRSDNARIEYERTLKALQDQQRAFGLQPPAPADIEKVRYPGEYNLLITGFSGRSPEKIQHDVRTFVGRHSTYVKFSIPELKLHSSSVARIEVVVADTLQIPTFIIEEMDKVAADVYNVKKPMIYTRALTRSILKATGTRAVTKKASNESEALGVLAWIAGVIGQEITEKADLRGWQSLPGKAHVNVVKLPPGVHELEFRYYSRYGRLINTEHQTIEIYPGNDLALIESLYWH